MELNGLNGVNVVDRKWLKNGKFDRNWFEFEISENLNIY